MAVSGQICHAHLEASESSETANGAAFLGASLSVGSLVLSNVLGLPIVIVGPESWGSGPPLRVAHKGVLLTLGITGPLGGEDICPLTTAGAGHPYCCHPGMAWGWDQEKGTKKGFLFPFWAAESPLVLRSEPEPKSS